MSEIMGQVQINSDKEMTPQNIQGLYRKFTSECPSGNLHLHEFKKFFGVNSKSREEELVFAEIVFRSFDTNKDGKLDFIEFVAAVNLIFRGKLVDKLKWSFKVYDRDGNGTLTRQEVRHIVNIITKIKRQDDSNVAENIEDICDRIFEMVDKNKDSEICLEEFIEGAEKDPWLMEQLKLDIGPADWLIGRSSPDK
ncbi:guanylyl cyclase-activating protein 2 [Kryptolebias marmoratus]|uniref:Guanylyl cyclase-activating protein 2-like n=1 Tax=Kryptolebias marmoratus TaxID=37003 RepID=A0A3Q2ZNX0_KRYMA|nr:guanylyl cyclase-activating protein 2 [Kryptolebias marmoratus]